MMKIALITVAMAALGPALVNSAEAYEWGGGSCVGYGCVRALHDEDYRPVRHYRTYEERPAVRVYERRTHRGWRHHDWDDDDE
ncbi:hypothetical protein [Methylobacterium nodulans]|uniref:Uncharacterized protein n=1 Tax=Methylobacterium nodulans (strain LMG 21967 / CNCM I-2342 / ORS 2060) TaxID=460265 RepID=B8INL7_METNO|nr:hypothetical protein [Methylobacterium nodulans]ACL56543.1 conserved hypothetical protein [Methylobacterium nodulans ORS 2060]